MNNQVSFEPKLLLESDGNRGCLTFQNLSNVRIKLIYNQLADNKGDSYVISIPASFDLDNPSSASLDGTYKGEIWAQTYEKNKTAEVAIIRVEE